MVVQHNMQAMNANRMLGITTRSQSKATEKLSSGYKINRAADDAAGLSISEKMRKQMRGLDQASTNAQDGISAVQTAEGALTEVHAMLQRMNELAVQAANGTNAESDRQSIQDEIEQLTTEIDRVAETTKFNESYLLKGNGKETTINIAAKDAGIAGELTGVGTGLATFKMSALDNGEQITIGSKGYTIGTSIEDVKANIPAATDDNTKVTINGTEYHVVEDGATDPANKYYTQAELQSMISDGDKVVIGSESYVAMIDGTGATAAEAQAALKAAVTAGDTVTIGGKAYTITSGNDTALKDGLANAKADIQSKIDNIGSDTITIGGTAYTAGNIDTLDLDTAVTATTAFNVGNGDVAVGTGAYVDDFEANLDTIAELIKDETEFSYDDNGTVKDVTVGTTILNNDGVGDNDASIITKEEAYRLIGEELLKAASVGCDPGSDAIAVDKDGKALADGTDAFELLDADGKVITDPTKYGEAVTVRYNVQEATVVAKQGLQFTLHVGADADESNKIALTIDAMDAAGLGIKNMNVLDNTGAKATYAIDSIADAIAKVSAQRSALGAIQNRLEHTIANLDNVVENTTAAESEIRDTDMAEAMVEYSKNNILMQAGQSMLAQANQSTQGVLSLLQ